MAGCSTRELTWHSPSRLDGPRVALVDYGAKQGMLDRPNTFVFTAKWYLSGKVDYALRGKMTVLCLSADDPGVKQASLRLRSLRR